MNLKMRKSLAIKEGILRFMGRIAALHARVSSPPPAFRDGAQLRPPGRITTS